MKRKVFDPPNGWRYGFPDVVPEEVDENPEKFRDWMLEKGYPERDIDFGMTYGRWWYEDQND